MPNKALILIVHGSHKESSNVEVILLGQKFGFEVGELVIKS